MPGQKERNVPKYPLHRFKSTSVGVWQKQRGEDQMPNRLTQRIYAPRPSTFKDTPKHGERKKHDYRRKGDLPSSPAGAGNLRRRGGTG